jgi:hypothetical protein
MQKHIERESILNCELSATPAPSPSGRAPRDSQFAILSSSDGRAETKVGLMDTGARSWRFHDGEDDVCVRGWIEADRISLFDDRLSVTKRDLQAAPARSSV